jgi:hypothetical protein
MEGVAENSQRRSAPKSTQGLGKSISHPTTPSPTTKRPPHSQDVADSKHGTLFLLYKNALLIPSRIDMSCCFGRYGSDLRQLPTRWGTHLKKTRREGMHPNLRHWFRPIDSLRNNDRLMRTLDRPHPTIASALKFRRYRCRGGKLDQLPSLI